MKKKILLIIISLITLVGIICAAFFFIDMYRFAKGELEDTKRQGFYILEKKINNGDIIFQTSKSSQSKAIQLATHSKYSHCGIIYKIKNDFFVFEAVQPVKLTSLKKWIDRGEDSKYVVKRLKGADTILTEANILKMRKIGESYKGKDYDIYFEWSDQKIYCSELIWKVYKKSLGIEIGKLQQLKDFDLSSNIVQNIMKKRYGDKIPYEELVVSPESIFDSEFLETIIKN